MSAKHAEHKTIQQQSFKLFLTIRQAARHTGLSELFLRKRLAENKLPGLHSGNRFMADVERLLENIRRLDEY